MRALNVLVACEASQTVCMEFRRLGHNAFSCDLLDCYGWHPEFHIKGDALKSVEGGLLTTSDGQQHHIQSWDIIIAHPPCTHLAVSGAKHFVRKREDGSQADAVRSFAQFLNLPSCKHIAIENPVGIVSGGKYLKTYFSELAEQYSLPHPASQKIQPYMFGDAFEKTTILWLKGLPKLEPTDIVKPEPRHITSGGKSLPAWYSNPAIRTGCKGNRQSVRSQTFVGIARAMAQQWSSFVLESDGGD